MPRSVESSAIGFDAPQGERGRRAAATPSAQAHQEDLLDEGIEETFPAGDPVSVKYIT